MAHPNRFKPFRVVLILLNFNLIVFSFILIIFGLSKIGVGVVEKYGLRVGGESRLKLPPSPSTIFITLGAISFVTGVVGLRSVDHFCPIIVYAVFVSLLALVDLSIGVSARFVEDRARNGVKLELIESVKQFNGDFSSPEIDWVRMQSELKCCGIMGYEDWSWAVSNATNNDDDDDDDTLSDAGVEHVVIIPQLGNITAACFQPIEEELVAKESVAFTQENVYSDGCLEKLVDELGFKGLERVGLILTTGKILAGTAASFVAVGLRRYNLIVTE